MFTRMRHQYVNEEETEPRYCDGDSTSRSRDRDRHRGRDRDRGSTAQRQRQRGRQTEWHAPEKTAVEAA